MSDYSIENAPILIIGAGIGGLIAAIALRRYGFAIEIVEKDPEWRVYGVGIIQQSNVVRVMARLGLLDEYISAGFGFNQVDIFSRTDEHVATHPSPVLVDGYPANIGIGRPALQEVLKSRAKAAGVRVRLGITATAILDESAAVNVTFSDGSNGKYSLVIGADGLYSSTRAILFPNVPKPQFSGQSVWRYNFPRPSDVVSLCTYEGNVGVGLCPLSNSEMYLFLTTAEPDNPRYPRAGIAALMRSKLGKQPDAIAVLADQITADAGVVYRPIDWLMLDGDWHKGRVVLLGDAVHGMSPHLGQGAGMAIEDAVVLAEEIARCDGHESAFRAYYDRRAARCRFFVEMSIAICFGQIGKGPAQDMAAVSKKAMQVSAQPI